MTYKTETDKLKSRGVRVQVVTTFDGLERIRDEFVIGHNGFKLPFLILIGQPGTAKSHSFEKSGARYINNAASPVGLFAAVYWCRAADNGEDQPIVLDDVDGLLSEKGATALFKALGSDRPRKHMSWLKQNTWLESQGVPTDYSTSSRLCILCNSVPKVSRDLQAVFDRAKTVIFSPTAREIHAYVKTWWEQSHADIYDYIGENLHRIAEPSIRWYTDTLREKRLGNDWRHWLLQTWYDENPELSVVAEIRSDRKWKTFDAQAAEFTRRTGLKRASYNLYLRKWKESQGEDTPNQGDVIEGRVGMAVR